MEKQWTQINNLCSIIYDKGDDAIRQMAESSFDLFEKEPDENIDELCIPFLRRLLARVEAGFELPPVNSVASVEMDGEQFFMIRNYDYPTFKWAMKCGFGKYIDCRILYVPKKKLSESAIKAIEKKIKS